MNTFVVLTALLAVATALVQQPGPTEADQPPNSLIQAAGPTAADQPANANVQAAGPDEDETNRINAARQHKTNVRALHFGASAGTAPYYGVPGTSVRGVHNDGYYGHGYGYGHHGGYYGGHHGGYYGGHHGGYYGGYGHHGNAFYGGRLGGYYRYYG